jgi:hypothetical protein
MEVLIAQMTDLGADRSASLILTPYLPIPTQTNPYIPYTKPTLRYAFAKVSGNQYAIGNRVNDIQVHISFLTNTFD